jgi:hypothetical protein
MQNSWHPATPPFYQNERFPPKSFTYILSHDIEIELPTRRTYILSEVCMEAAWKLAQPQGVYIHIPYTTRKKVVMANFSTSGVPFLIAVQCEKNHRRSLATLRHILYTHSRAISLAPEQTSLNAILKRTQKHTK